MLEIIWQIAKAAALLVTAGAVVAAGMGMSWLAAEVEREEERRRRRGCRR